MTYQRVCDACRKPIDADDMYVEVVVPEGQRHFHDDGVCWTTIKAALAQGIQAARDQKKNPPAG